VTSTDGNTIAAPASVHGLLLSRARQHPARTCLVFEGTRYSYAEVAAQSMAAASALRSIGIRRGDRVALMLGNRPEFLFLWFGCSMLGAVEVPVNTAQKGELLAYVLERAECRAIIAEAAHWPQLAPVIERPRSLEYALLLDDLPAHEGRVRLGAFESLPRGKFVPDESIGGDDPHAIMFTSGTTGPSKGAVMPQRFPLFIGNIVVQAAQYTAEDVLFNALPLFHGNAQFLSTVPALLAGAQIVLARKFSASQFWSEVRRYGCTEFNYIGGIIPMLMKAEPSPADRDHQLRIMFGAGAPQALFRSFEQRFAVRLIEGYGMSEVGIPLLATDACAPPGSCGREHPSYEVRLVDDAGRDVPDGTAGELLVRPRELGVMMREYYGMPERTVESWRDLWFHTGDYLRRDNQGYYWFVDRKKDALRRRGENISSWEVEHIVNAHPGVLESAAIPVPADVGEDEVMVCVVRRSGSDIGPAELAAFCEQRMPKFMVPRFIRFLTALPKTPTERIQKFELRAQGVTKDTWDRLGSVSGGST
jgi:carnitine-CoA ligase